MVEVLSPGAIKPCKIVIGICLLRVLFDGLFIVGFCVRPFLFLEMGISKIKIGDRKFFGGQSIFFDRLVELTFLLIGNPEIDMFFRSEGVLYNNNPWKGTSRKREC